MVQGVDSGVQSEGDAVTDDEEGMVQRVPLYVVCRQCRHIYDMAHDMCPQCSELLGDQEGFFNKTLAEAYAVGQWLREGYSLIDVQDPYFNPRR